MACESPLKKSIYTVALLCPQEYSFVLINTRKGEKFNGDSFQVNKVKGVDIGCGFWNSENRLFPLVVWQSAGRLDQRLYRNQLIQTGV